MSNASETREQSMDFDETDAAHDMSLPYLAGVTDEILAHLPEIPDSSLVLDLACGTGEPGLTLARRRQDIQLTGIDTEQALLKAARAKAGSLGLDNIQFTMASVDNLPADAGSGDAAISRMGFLLPGTGDPARSAQELARVLKPGAPFSFAVWTDLASSPYSDLGLKVLRSVLPAEQVPDFDAMFAEVKLPRAIERWLLDAGISTADGAWFSWAAECPDFDTWWAFDTGAGPLKPLFDALDNRQTEAARVKMAELMSPYRTASGTYRMPATARLIWGKR